MESGRRESNKNPKMKKALITSLVVFITTITAFVANITGIFEFFTGKNFTEFFHPVGQTTTQEDSITENKSGENIDNPSPPIDNGDPTGPDSTETNTKSTKKLTMSRFAYIEELHRVIGSDIDIKECYADFNHDGNFEMFALVTIEDNDALGMPTYDQRASYALREEELLFANGQIWFVNQDGARNISHTDIYGNIISEYWAVLDIFTFGEDKFLPCLKSGASSDYVYLWGVTSSGEPYQPEISEYGGDILLNDHNEIELFPVYIDFYFYSGVLGGKTQKPYYFYWDGNSFKEYGGALISIDSLYSINGSKELLEQVYSELEQVCAELIGSASDIQIKEVYYRENGVININYQCRQNISDDNYFNYNVTLRYEDGELRIVPGENGLLRDGFYHPAHIDFIAIYPETPFESLFG